MPPDETVRTLKAGFDLLLQDCQRLAIRGQKLERHLQVLREQAKPSLSSDFDDGTASDLGLGRNTLAGNIESWWSGPVLGIATDHVDAIRQAITASSLMNASAAEPCTAPRINGDRSSAAAGSTSSPPMPSITESPLELDFTTAGVPSKLDCPFNSLARRRLSPHAASVVARYRPNGTRTPRSSVSRVDGRASSAARSAAGSGTDKDGGICGALEAPRKLEGSVQAAGGVCPIRFLDKNTPEEVADYFEQHKHEVPRSHELCVKRYQGDSKSLQELDAKYGSLVSVIKGLGEKHAPMLPGRVSDDVERESNDKETDERVRKWSQAISAGELPDPHPSDALADDSRTSHFDRPMKEVRVGESPSRPWGIHVPSLDDVTGPENKTLADQSTTLQDVARSAAEQARAPASGAVAGSARCPFGFDSKQPLPADHPPLPVEGLPEAAVKTNVATGRTDNRRPVFIAGDDQSVRHNMDLAAKMPDNLNGPVFVGYSAAEAVSILKGMDLI